MPRAAGSKGLPGPGSQGPSSLTARHCRRCGRVRGRTAASSRSPSARAATRPPAVARHPAPALTPERAAAWRERAGSGRRRRGNAVPLIRPGTVSTIDYTTTRCCVPWRTSAASRTWATRPSAGQIVWPGRIRLAAQITPGKPGRFRHAARHSLRVGLLGHGWLVCPAGATAGDQRGSVWPALSGGMRPARARAAGAGARTWLRGRTDRPRRRRRWRPARNARAGQ